MSIDAVNALPAFTICDRLRKARERTGLDQAGFAAELGVSRGTVSTYERDEGAAFKPIVLRQWAIRSGVPLKWIQTGEVPATTPPDGEATTTTGALERLASRKRARHAGAADTRRYAAA